jgi:hypothetical protein
VLEIACGTGNWSKVFLFLPPIHSFFVSFFVSFSFFVFFFFLTSRLTIAQFIAEKITTNLVCVDGSKEVIQVLKDKFESDGFTDALKNMEFFVQDVFSPDWLPPQGNVCIRVGERNF